MQIWIQPVKIGLKEMLNIKTTKRAIFKYTKIPLDFF